jgi:hypothetical protein
MTQNYAISMTFQWKCCNKTMKCKITTLKPLEKQCPYCHAVWAIAIESLKVCIERTAEIGEDTIQ